MKLSVTQAILSVLIIFAAVYVTGWMIHKAPMQFQQPVVNEGGGIHYIDVVPEDEALFNVSRYSSYALPVLGVLVLVIGVIQSVKTDARSRSLITVNIIAGALTVVLAGIILRWGYPTTFHFISPEGTNMLGTIFTNPGRSLIGVQTASGIIAFLGAAICGVGVVQLATSKR